MEFKEIEKILSANVEGQISELENFVHPADILEAIIDRDDLHELLMKFPKTLIVQIMEQAEEETQLRILEHFSDD